MSKLADQMNDKNLSEPFSQKLIILGNRLKNNLWIISGLHSALLRLLATNYPHLCLVEDWVCEEEVTGTLPLLRRMMLPTNTCRYTQSQLHQGEQVGNDGLCWGTTLQRDKVNPEMCHWERKMPQDAL